MALNSIYFLLAKAAIRVPCEVLLKGNSNLINTGGTVPHYVRAHAQDMCLNGFYLVSIARIGLNAVEERFGVLQPL